MMLLVTSMCYQHKFILCFYKFSYFIYFLIIENFLYTVHIYIIIYLYIYIYIYTHMHIHARTHTHTHMHTHTFFFNLKIFLIPFHLPQAPSLLITLINMFLEFGASPVVNATEGFSQDDNEYAVFGPTELMADLQVTTAKYT